MNTAQAVDSETTFVGPAEYEARVRQLLPTVAARSAGAEAARRLPTETVADFQRAGLFRVFQPRRWGGFELPPMTFFSTIYELSRVCPSTGWVYGVIGPHSWEVAALPDEAQRDVWAENPQVLVSSSFAPTGKVEKVAGGYILDGTWKYSSGCDACDWAIVGGAVARVGSAPDMRNFLLPRSDYEIVDTWRTMGLKGTGSNDLVIRRAFVPEYRSNSHEDLYYCNNPGRLHNTGPLYRLPFMALFSPLLAFAALGAASGAHAHFVKYIASAAGVLNKGYDLAEEPATHLRLAAAISDIEASYALLASLIDQMYADALAGRDIPLLLRKRIRFESAQGVERATRAALEIFRASGTSVINIGHPIQRFVLDVLCARTHIANNIDRVATLYARELLGVAGPPRGPGDFNT
jgi:3-hydroxy-9,10-secoandrosta-1,3,5(10)-triene-9,17-dione monooxygenase